MPPESQQKPSNVLAFDYGTKSIGIASTYITSELSSSCSEQTPIKAKDGIPSWQELEKLLNEWKPTKVIVGLPYDSDGTDMEITRRARKFGNRLHGRFGVDVEFIDETLSTREAKHEAHERGHSGHYSKKPVDSIAARLILESWLQNNT